MRKNYPLLSQEMNDIFQDLYYKLVYIIGYNDEEGNPKYQGMYDKFEQEIRAQINYLIFDLMITEQPVYPTWGRFSIRNELRRL